MENILSVNNLKFSYKNKNIFDDVSFDIKDKSINCIIGSNNCGKSTLIKVISGILPFEKCIKYDNKLITKKNFKEYILNIGIVLFGNKNKFLNKDVLSELVFPLENLNYSKKEISNRIKYVSGLFEINDIIHKKIFLLSEFEKVKLSLAVSIMHKPKLLLLDDVFENITYSQYQYLINKLRILGIAVLYTTNNINNIMECDRVIVLDNKKIIYDLSPLELLEHDNALSKMGIIIPLMIDISLKLKFYNILSEIIMTPEGLVDELWK